MSASATKIIEPQDGFQKKFLSSPADIVIGGSAAGVGKTWALLADPLRAIHVERFAGAIFRRTTPQIRNPGGILDASREIYNIARGELKETTLDWNFGGKSRISFRHLEYENNIYDWQGSEIPFIGFDELTHFSATMFFYLLSRNRSTCGVNPWTRATCNPDPDSWVAEFIQWWIDDDGFIDKEKEGVLRYYTKFGGEFIWGDTMQEVAKKAEHFLRPMIEKSGGLVNYKDLIKSLTVIGGSIYDNKELLRVNPQYLGNLLSQSEEDQLRLLGGNWKVKPNNLDIYDYHSFVGCFHNVREVSRLGRYITADIAMEGSNKFIVGYWEGRELMDIEIVDKNLGDEVIIKISDFAKKYSVNNQYICYDADGVGNFIKGYVRGSVPFHGGIAAMEVKDEVSGGKFKEYYANLKTQCYYRSGKAVKDGEIKISEYVANKMYSETMTVRQRMMYERKAIKKLISKTDGKLRIIPKEEMKAMLNGESPDLLDMVMMREIFDLKPAKVFLYADN